ncbi:inorganic phosphate transporter [Stappia sp. ES.058]|uniref:inorganic phosphate transporter n=1 Tax=Stappia sp. ES.058 TaxID=1881061 RepID=UPI000B82807E|nr:inorganic phosphate transporter [Stappia sp. ES.058]
MSNRTVRPPGSTIDKDLDKLGFVEEATGHLSRSLIALGFAVLFIVMSASTAALIFFDSPHWFLLTAALALGGYMALNIGANDVANNVGPAVGARVMTMTSALVLAALCESAGALLAGGEVVTTISTRIVDVGGFSEQADFPIAMLAALVAAALWINIATVLGAPVSTTHAVVGGVVGAAMMSAGSSVVSWGTVGAIAASWVVSPLLGGLVAAALLALVKTFIIYRTDKIGAAKRWLPVMFGMMAGTFALYLVVVGLSRSFGFEPREVIAIVAGVSVGTYLISRRMIARAATGLENRNQSLRRLFRIPLIAAAAVLSFAHGANDVANAVGPVAAIFSAFDGEGRPVVLDANLFPVLVVGALGISLGLLLFGPRLVRMVGERITRLNPIRAYCVALATGATVLLASGLGLPVSSTHIAVGAVFGVGFYREWFMNRARKRRFCEVWPLAIGLPALQRREPADMRRRKLVRRAHVLTIVSAWGVTVPASAMLAALVFMLFSVVR